MRYYVLGGMAVIYAGDSEQMAYSMWRWGSSVGLARVTLIRGR